MFTETITYLVSYICIVPFAMRCSHNVKGGWYFLTESGNRNKKGLDMRAETWRKHFDIIPIENYLIRNVRRGAYTTIRVDISGKWLTKRNNVWPVPKNPVCSPACSEIENVLSIKCGDVSKCPQSVPALHF